jgi:hypothetical protein
MNAAVFQISFKDIKKMSHFAIIKDFHIHNY